MNKNFLSREILCKPLRYKHFFRIMKIATLFLFVLIFCLHAENTNSQNVSITLKKSDTELENVLNDIEKQTDYLFVYNKFVNVNRKVSVDWNKCKLDDVLKLLFAGTEVQYTVDGSYIVLSAKNTPVGKGKTSIPVVQQNKKISGVVKDKSGEPIIGANIVVKDSKSLGTVTDVDGKFSLEVGNGKLLTVSYIGYDTKEVSIGNGKNLIIILSEDTKTLDEVVVIGYGTVKKSNLISAVSKIDNESIKERPVMTVGDALQGQLSGVRAQNTSGMPGQDLQIRIRGVNTINGSSDPLYVIDGVPRENMNDLNPNDVASIQVLKDASATSIYGARGANGVILIETKQGTGKPTVSFDGYYGLQRPEKFINMMDKDEWVAYNTFRRNVAYLRDGGSMKDPMSNRPGNQQVPDVWSDPDLRETDWQDAIMRTAPIQSYQVSASAKGDIGNIYVSAGYMDQQGIIKETYYNRLNFRLNATVNVNKNLRVGVNIAPSFANQDYKSSQGKETALHHALNMSPLADINSCTKEWGFPTGLGQTYYNPLVRLQTMKDRTEKGKVASSVWADYQIIKGLVFKTQFSYNYAVDSYEYFLPSNVNADGDISLGKSNTKIWADWSVQNTLTYQNTFNEVHDLNVMLGQSADEYRYNAIFAEGNNYPNESLPTLNLATTPTLASTNRNKRRSASFFGRVSYAFKDKYLVAASMRYDGSSRFGGNKKWGVFPSFSAGWKLNEENFLKDLDWISLLKVRASWGMAGNDRIGNYDYMPLISAFKTSMGNSVQAAVGPANIENPDLQWESTKTTDVGFDFYAFNNRLQFGFDYYINKTDNLLFNVPIPSTTGFSSLRTNLGSIRNQGWEIDITSHNLTGEFKWSTSLNLSANKNKVLDMGDITEFTSQHWDARFITRVGGPVTQFLCYRTDGLLTAEDFEADGKTPKPGVAIMDGQEPGNVRYVDQPNKDGKRDGKITSDDMVAYGNNIPDLIYGLTNRFAYKGFELSLLLQGQIGGDLCFLGQRHMDNGAGDTNQFGRWLHCWKPDFEKVYGPGENPVPTGIDMSWDGKTPYPFGVNDNNSDLRIYDATYLRIKNITLSYTLPRHLLSKGIVRNAKFYISIDNLATFDSYPGATPETNSFGNATTMAGLDYSTYPLTKKYTFGVNVTF